MNTLPAVVCGRCARLSLGCTYVQPDEHGPYAWWCDACVDGEPIRLASIRYG